MKRSLKVVLLLGAYFLLIFSPLIFLIVGPHMPGREFWREFSVAIGFAALSLMAMQFVHTARMPFMADVFPMDVLYTFHHRLSLFTFVLVLAHPVILFIFNPYTLRLLNPLTAPTRAQAGVFAVLAVIALIVTSVRRKAYSIEYEPWRLIHGVFGFAAVALVLYHIFSVNYHMSDPFQRAVWFIQGIIWLGMVAYVRVIKPWRMIQRPYEVAAVIPELGNSWTLILDPIDHPGMNFTAGQVAWLTVRQFPFIMREHPFSFSGSAEHPEQLKFTIKELGDFTSRIHELEEGECVYVDGPYGTFGIAHHKAPSYVLIAGGIGSSPMMSILRTMADRNDQSPVLFIYANKSWDKIVFREELEDLEEKINLRVVHVLENPPEGWEGETGFVTPDILERHVPEEGREEAEYLLCGPLPMIELVQKGLQDLGVPLRQIHAERYEMA